MREEIREGWKKQRSKRNSFIQPIFPPPAPTVEKYNSALREMTTSLQRNTDREGADRKCRCFVDLSVERCDTENNLFELDSDKSCSVAQKQTTDRDTNVTSTGM